MPPRDGLPINTYHLMYNELLAQITQSVRKFRRVFERQFGRKPAPNIMITAQLCNHALVRLLAAFRSIPSEAAIGAAEGGAWH